MFGRSRIAALVLTLALLPFLPSRASATGTRIQSMGGATKALTVPDVSGVWFFPGWIADHPHQGFLDTYSGAGGLFGVHYALNADIVLAIYGGNTRVFTYGGDGAASEAQVPPSAHSFTEGPAVGMLPGQVPGAALDPGEQGSNFKGAVGVGVRSGDTRYGGILAVYGDNTGAGSGTAKGPLGLQAIGGMSMGMGDGELDLGGLFEFGTMTSKISNSADFVGTGHFSMDLYGRYSLPAAPGVDAVPYLVLEFGDQSVKKPSAGTTWATTEMGITAGADLRIRPGDDVEIYPGAGLLFRDVKTNSATSGVAGSTLTNRVLAVPFFSLGIDARITKNLDWRLGAVQIDVLSRTKRQLKGTPPSVDLKESAAQVHFATGFGMHFGSWTIDLNVNPRVFLNGPHVVTGKETDPFAFDAALHYAW